MEAPNTAVPCAADRPGAIPPSRTTMLVGSVQQQHAERLGKEKEHREILQGGLPEAKS
jgi:hypothetical protein